MVIIAVSMCYSINSLIVHYSFLQTPISYKGSPRNDPFRFRGHKTAQIIRFVNYMLVIAKNEYFNFSICMRTKNVHVQT